VTSCPGSHCVGTACQSSVVVAVHLLGREPVSCCRQSSLPRLTRPCRRSVQANSAFRPARYSRRALSFKTAVRPLNDSVQAASVIPPVRTSPTNRVVAAGTRSTQPSDPSGFVNCGGHASLPPVAVLLQTCTTYVNVAADPPVARLPASRRRTSAALG